MLTTVEAGPVHVKGVSVGGLYTSLYVPEMQILLDVGMAARSLASTNDIFISHGHVDHIGSLTTLLGARALTGKRRPPRVFMPAEIVDDVKEALQVLTRLQRYDLEIQAVGLKPNESYPLRGDLEVRARRTYHPVPSLAYVFSRKVSKLKSEFHGLSGPEIRDRKHAGDDLFDVVERIELAYATDTLAKVLDQEPDLLNAQVLILESTFLDERKSLADTRAGCHIHLDEIIERADSFKNEKIVLMHFSQLYRPADVHQILKERLPESLLSRVVPFAPRKGSWPG